MPRYFFDLKDDEGVHRDEVGVELPDLATARIEARRALLEISRDRLAVDGQDAHLEMLIRDSGPGPVRVSIRLSEES